MKKYQIIYADPAWKILGWDRNPEVYTKSAGHHYQIQEIGWIKALRVRDISDTNCALFLWVTSPVLEESFDVIKSWGFSYSTIAFTWVKKTKNGLWHFGLGAWTRANPEMCLLATKGKPHRVSKSVRQLIVEPVREHSRKPDRVRDDIVQLMGDLPRIELFARQKTEGWDTWGNEVTNDIELEIK